MLDKDGKALRNEIISQTIPALIASNSKEYEQGVAFTGIGENGELVAKLTPLDEAIIEKAILIANATVNTIISKQMGVS